LRKKYRQNMRPSEANWRVVMGRCFLLAFGAIDRDRAWARIQELAGSIGEDVFARVYLWLMLNYGFARFFEDLKNHEKLPRSA